MLSFFVPATLQEADWYYVIQLPTILHVEFDEYAGILEYVQGLPRERAERLALEYVRKIPGAPPFDDRRG